MKFHEKLREALGARLGESIEVHVDAFGLVVLDEVGTSARSVSRVGNYLPGVGEINKRSTPSPELLSEVIERAALALSRDIPKYKPEFVSDAEAFVARLRKVATS